MPRAASLEAESFVALLQSLLRELTIGSDDPAAEFPLAQLRICRLLCDGAQPFSSISRELRISPSAVTQSADRLERAGLVTRLADGNDRRVRCLELTEQGETMMRLHDKVRIQRMAAALEQLSSKQRHDATTALQTLIRASAVANGRDGDGEKRRPYFPKSEVLL